MNHASCPEYVRCTSNGRLRLCDASPGICTVPQYSVHPPLLLFPFLHQVQLLLHSYPSDPSSASFLLYKIPLPCKPSTRSAWLILKYLASSAIARSPLNKAYILTTPILMIPSYVYGVRGKQALTEINRIFIQSKYTPDDCAVFHPWTRRTVPPSLDMGVWIAASRLTSTCTIYSRSRPDLHDAVGLCSE